MLGGGLPHSCGGSIHHCGDFNHHGIFIPPPIVPPALLPLDVEPRPESSARCRNKWFNWTSWNEASDFLSTGTSAAGKAGANFATAAAVSASRCTPLVLLCCLLHHAEPGRLPFPGEDSPTRKPKKSNHRIWVVRAGRNVRTEARILSTSLQATTQSTVPSLSAPTHKQHTYAHSLTHPHGLTHMSQYQT